MRRLDLPLGEPGTPPALTAGDQLLALVNPSERELLVRVERAGDRAFALTAARVMATAVFRELFPDQSLAPGRLMAVTQASLVIARARRRRRAVRRARRREGVPGRGAVLRARRRARQGGLGGSLVKTFGGLAIAAFERPGPAVEMAMRVQVAADADPITRGLLVRTVVHRGPLMAMSQAGRLDYFGQNLEAALAIAAATPPATVALTSAVCADAGVAERVKEVAEPVISADPAVLGDGAWVMRIRAPRAESHALPTSASSAADSVPTVIRPTT